MGRNCKFWRAQTKQNEMPQELSERAHDEPARQRGRVLSQVTEFQVDSNWWKVERAEVFTFQPLGSV